MNFSSVAQFNKTQSVVTRHGTKQIADETRNELYFREIRRCHKIVSKVLRKCIESGEKISRYIGESVDNMMKFFKNILRNCQGRGT